jgi:bile acid-coenzyme A ligase
MGNMAMFGTLAHHAARVDRPAVVCGDREISYASLSARAESVAGRLRRLGVDRGDLVALALPNSIEFFVALFAVYRLDATPFPLSTTLPTPELESILETAQPSLVVDPAFDLSDDAGGVDELPEVRAEQPWKAIGSGGSTGRPKVIVAGRPACVDVGERQYGVTPGDTVLVPGPLYHQGPFIFSTGALFTGGTAVVMPRFDAEETLATVERRRVTFLYLVPTMIHRIWRLDPAVRDAYDLSSLRMVLSTGAPWAPWLKKAWIEWLGPDRIVEAYGGTEEQGGLTISGRESLAHPGSIGAAHEHVVVFDDHGAALPVGAVGELHFRNPGAASHTSLGAEIMEREGWRSYGDLGWISEDGYVYLADRRTDLIVSGGANVYPAELEGALEAHDAVRSAVVIGLPDDDLGQRVHAIVDVGKRTPDDALVAEINRHLRSRIAGWKAPREYELVDSPLRDEAGKVRRAALREARLSGEPGPS